LRVKNLVVACLVFYAIVAACFLAWSFTDAREPTAHGVLPMPSPWPSASTHPIVHSCGVRCPVSAPAPAPALPDTDTDQSPAVTVVVIWVTAILVILVAWHQLAYHDD
jgi:hypothetical protein